MNATPSELSVDEIQTRWVAVLRGLHAHRTYAYLTDDPYRFEVQVVGDGGADLFVHAYFRGDDRYCCVEPGCHFISSGLDRPGPDWARLRQAMADGGLGHLGPVRIRQWRVTVEAGATIHDHDRGKRPDYVEDEPWCYWDGPFIEPPAARAGP